MADVDGYHEQLQRDAQFLCSDLRMDTDLVDKLVLQLNRIYPQILTDKEAHKFRNLSVPTKVRLAELLKHLQVKGEEACHEFYRGLHIHAEDIYFSLPTRVKRRGPMFFLSCLSFAVGLAMLYYYGEGDTLRGTSPLLHCSAAGLSKGAKDVFISYADVGTKKK
ncbi:caspase recruitment domain-containing protein 19-like isoform X3 [Myripristis murdjan]|uniref:caspase recruitment domain-containing protein 19-like isoform X3 n=1 Tax=Myripristis murdjan TaxID=586833 RepID=UPI0011763F31|nr:caspase recruitment domain-containing protein 19-like isoform X3 [Myripristis murdjan]